MKMPRELEETITRRRITTGALPPQLLIAEETASTSAGEGGSKMALFSRPKLDTVGIDTVDIEASTTVLALGKGSSRAE